MSVGDPHTTIVEPTFAARFVLAARTDTVDTAANVDVFVDLPDGTAWARSYFCVADQLIVLAAGVVAMTAAIHELVGSEDITRVCIRLGDPDEGACWHPEEQP